jgi:hypothetical protein
MAENQDLELECTVTSLHCMACDVTEQVATNEQASAFLERHRQHNAPIYANATIDAPAECYGGAVRISMESSLELFLKR